MLLFDNTKITILKYTQIHHHLEVQHRYIQYQQNLLIFNSSLYPLGSLQFHQNQNHSQAIYHHLLIFNLSLQVFSSSSKWKSSTNNTINTTKVKFWFSWSWRWPEWHINKLNISRWSWCEPYHLLIFNLSMHHPSLTGGDNWNHYNLLIFHLSMCTQGNFIKINNNQYKKYTQNGNHYSLLILNLSMRHPGSVQFHQTDSSILSFWWICMEP